MPLTAIAAMDPDRVIGRDGRLPWHLPEDLKLFKKLTLGHPIVMGRRTWDSLPRHPLPGRRNIVISRTLEFPDVTVLPELHLLGPSLGTEAAYLIGGAALYAVLLPFCHELILTHVHARYPGDVRFPDYTGMFEPAETLATTEDFHVTRYRNHDPLSLP